MSDRARGREGPAIHSIDVRSIVYYIEWGEIFRNN